MSSSFFIDGVKVFGMIRGHVMPEDCQHVRVDRHVRLHVVRHFAQIDKKSREALRMMEANSHELAEITDEVLDQLLQTAGSKFNPKLQDVAAIVTTVLQWTKEQIETGLEAVWIEFDSLPGKYCTQISFPISAEQKTKLGLLESEHVGSLGLVLINKTNEHFVQKEQRGSVESTDSLMLNVIRNLIPEESDLVTVGLVKDPETQSVSLTSMYTGDGKFSPSFPNASTQSREEFEYNKTWWGQHAFFK